jgi:4-hydroxy-tetrahydrodipicolinate reductase
MTIKVAVTGARGRMGSMILAELSSNEDMELVAGFDIVGEGTPLQGTVLTTSSSQMEDVLLAVRPDVLIDFTAATAAVENVLVVGTTGFSEEQMATMKKAIAEGNVAAVISPNFSLGVNVFWKLLETAARTLKDYDIEVVEAHHRMKKDAPSGTALAAVEALKRATGIDEVVYGREGVALRGREIGVHAVRAGDIVGDHTVIFAGPGERLEIRHQAHSRAAFASGAVRAAIWVAQAKPGVYNIADVLNE